MRNSPDEGTRPTPPFAVLKFPTKLAEPVGHRYDVASRLKPIIPRMQALADKRVGAANWFIEFMDRFLSDWGV
jgi:hypothetical protein